jgi:hypothetical protein
VSLFPLAPIIARLRQAAPILRKVGSAADLAAAGSAGAVRVSPTATVILLGIATLEVKEGSGPLRQTLEPTVGVLVGVTLAGDQGERGLLAIEEPTDQVRAALFGWGPPGTERRFHIADEGIEDFDAKTGVLLYRLDFTTRIRIQEPLS